MLAVTPEHQVEGYYEEERGENLYQTGPEAMHTLFALEKFGPLIWEPACGRGAISRMLEAEGYEVRISDLVDYGTATADGELQDVADFLVTEADGSGTDIVTNPPYGAVLNAFVAHALRVHRPRKMALLLNVNFYGGTENDDRNLVLDQLKPSRIWWNARRLPMMHRDGWQGNKTSSSMNTGWFVWELQEDGSYGNQTVISRVDWTDYVPAQLLDGVDLDEVAA
ncbi:MAG: class I SAM-dependent methyltransferase [Spirochaetia bacterium]|nr:MAG: class I SAM-dependent methyltransferase [Spirochaetia bacterium]